MQPACHKSHSHGGTNYDTPSLRALWLTAPYLHDGSATTLHDVFHGGNVHAVAGEVSTADMDDLVAFLRALP